MPTAPLNAGKFVWPRDAATTLSVTRPQFDALVLGVRDYATKTGGFGEIGDETRADDGTDAHQDEVEGARGQLARGRFAETVPGFSGYSTT